MPVHLITFFVLYSIFFFFVIPFIYFLKFFSYSIILYKLIKVNVYLVNKHFKNIKKFKKVLILLLKSFKKFFSFFSFFFISFFEIFKKFFIFLFFCISQFSFNCSKIVYKNLIADLDQFLHYIYIITIVKKNIFQPPFFACLSVFLMKF